MMIALTKFLPLAVQAVRILKAVADRVMEATPEERTEIGARLRAIYDILRHVTNRESTAETTSLPMPTVSARVGRYGNGSESATTAISRRLTSIQPNNPKDAR